MPDSTNVTGAAFALQSVEPRSGNAVLRVRYTNDPLSASPAGAHDGRNITNYTLTGPQVRTITGVATVDDDPQSLDITLSAPLVTGTWLLAVANVRTAFGDTLSAPTSLSFEVSVATTIASISQGAENDSAEDLLRKYLSKALRGRFIDGLLAAFAVGERLNWDNAKAAFDQLFKITASGIYLDRKTADDGLIRPETVGMSDDLWRQYSIKITSKKLTPQVLLEIMEVFYGSDACRAFTTTGGSEPFALGDGYDLNILADERDVVQVVFDEDDFAQVSQAKAFEVAAAITRQFRRLGLKGFAVEFEDPESGEKKVRIYSSALGLAGAIRIEGGRAQNTLQFPDLLEDAEIAETWTVSEPEAGVARFTLTGASTVDLNLVRTGDYVNIYGSDVPLVNRGSFEITKVDVRYPGGTLTQYFEVANPEVQSGDFDIIATTDLLFFRPSRKSATGRVVVSQPEPGVLNIVLPATTQAVNRTIRTASYAQVRSSLTPTSLKRIGSEVEVTFGSAHGLVAGEWVWIDDVYPKTAKPSDTAGSSTLSSYNPVTGWMTASNINSAVATHNGAAVRLADGRAMFSGGRRLDAGVDNGLTSHVSLYTPGSVTTQSNGGKQHGFAWAAGTSMPETREGHKLTLLASSGHQANKVLLTGGTDSVEPSTNEGWLYNPVANTWSGSMTMNRDRAEHTATLLNDGRVFIAGGNNGVTARLEAEVFTPNATTGAFTGLTNMAVKRAAHTATKLSDGRVILIGGRTYTVDMDDMKALDTSTIFTPGADTWSEAAARMSYGRADHKAILLADDLVLVIGGKGQPANEPAATPAWLKSAEIYDAARNRWYPAGEMGVAHENFEAHYVQSLGKVIVHGGGITEAFDVATRTWSRIGGTLATIDTRKFAQAVLLANDAILVATGTIGTSDVISAYLFVANSNGFASGAINGQFKITSVPTSTTLKFIAPEGFTEALGTVKLTPATAVGNTDIPGPFIFDPYDGLSITETATTTTEAVNAGIQKQTLKVVNAASFPDEKGWIVLGFGTEFQSLPIQYLGRLNSTELILDYGHIFDQTVAAGASITLLDGRSAYLPENPPDAGGFYLTASSAGRVAASKAVDDTVAAGVTVEKSISYPGDRGLGGEGQPTEGAEKLSDAVAVWAGDSIDEEVEAAKEG